MDFDKPFIASHRVSDHILLQEDSLSEELLYKCLTNTMIIVHSPTSFSPDYPNHSLPLLSSSKYNA